MTYEDQASQTGQTQGLLFADIVDGLADRLDDGESVDIEQVVRDYPQFEHRLREIYDSLKRIYSLRPSGAMSTEEDSNAPTATPKKLGDFQIMRELGRGGMGIVYEAIEQALERRVALKVLPYAALLDDRQLKRFRTEARAAAMLKHPNIVSVYSVGHERGVHFFAMELIEGCSLANLVNGAGLQSPRGASQKTARTTHRDAKTATEGSAVETQPLASLSTEFSTSNSGRYRRVASLGIDAANALHYAHQEGVFHRDIKPANLLLDREGKIYVADFGLARTQTQDDLTMTGDVIGTMRYMSPEQMQGKLVDARADVYSLGLSLYELISGRPAFDAPNRMELSRQIAETEPPLLRRIVPSVPRDLENIVHKAISRNIDARYSSANELSEDLQRFVEHRPVRARPVGTLELVWRWCLRNQAKAALLVLSLTVLVALAILGPLYARQQTALVVEKNEFANKQAALAETRRQDLYAAHMKEAHQAMLRGEHKRAKELLDLYLPGEEKRPDLRGFEWEWLRSQTQRQNDAPIVKSDSLSVHVVVRSPDGGRIVIGTYGGDLACFDSASLKNLWRIPDSRKTLVWRSIKFSVDGRYIVAGSRIGDLDVMRASDGKRLHRRKLAGRAISSLALSKDGVLAIGTGGGLEDEPTSATQILLYRVVEEAEDNYSLDPITELEAGVGSVRGLAFSADAKELYGISNEPQIHLWSVPEFHPLPAISLDGRIPTALELSRESVVYVGTSFDERELDAKLHKIQDGKEVWSQSMFNLPIRDISISLDQSRIAACGKGGRIHVYDAKDGKNVDRIFGHSPTAFTVEFALGNDMFSGGGDGVARKWRVNDSIPPDGLNVQPQDIQGFDYMPDGKHILTGGIDGVIRIIDIRSGGATRTSKAFSQNITSVAVSPNGQAIAFGRDLSRIPGEEVAAFKESDGGGVQIWDSTLTKRLMVVDDQHRTKTFDLAFLNDRKLISASNDKPDEAGVHVWDIETGQLIHRMEQTPKAQHGYFRVVVSPQKKYIAATCFGAEAVVWDAATYQQVAMLRPSAETGTIGFFGIAFSPDGKLIAIGDHSGKLLLWDYRTQDVRTLAYDSHLVADVDFSIDGRRLVAGGTGATIRIWDTSSGRELFVSRDATSWVWRTRFSPGGNLLTACTSTGYSSAPNILFWRVSPEPP